MSPFVRGFATTAMLVTIFACGMWRHPVSGPPATESAGVEAAGSCGSPVVPPDAQFPPGFDYPQTSTAVHAQWSTNGGGHRARLHAYCLFAGLNVTALPLNIPTWRTWKTSSQAFATQYNPWIPSDKDGAPIPGAQASQPMTINESRSRASGRFGDIRNKGPIYGVNDRILSKPEYQDCIVPIPDLPSGTPPLFKLKDGQVFQSNGDIMIATVSYNTPALTNILTNTLYRADMLDKQLPAAEAPPNTLRTPMPAGSIVLKAMFWPVAGGSPSLTALPIWDWDRNRPGSASDNQYAGYEMQEFWKRAVAISSAPVERKNSTAAVAFLFGVRDKEGKPLPKNLYAAPIVGLDRFYSLSSAKIKSLSLSNCDRAILDASAYWLYNREFRDGDSLALIAMHIMTKEQPSWTFQSAWWHPDAQSCPKGNNNRFCRWGPDSVRTGDVTWKNYMMVTTYGANQQQGQTNYSAPLNTTGPVWPVIYNPYIELAATHPITTNCMNCHARAAWPPDDPDHKPDRGRASAYLQTDSPHPNPLETFTTSTGPFKGLLMLDNMWAVSDRAGYPVPEEQPAH